LSGDSDRDVDKCWLCREEITENKKFMLTCGHFIHRQCARNLDHSNDYINSLKCALCEKESIGLEELYVCNNGCQIYVILFHENKPVNFIPIKYDLEMKFRDVKQMIYWKERMAFDGYPKKLLFQLSHDFFYCVKKMDDNSTIIENEHIKTGSILRLEPNKNKTFNMEIDEILQVYREDTFIHKPTCISMSKLKNLGSFTITPYVNKKIRIHIEVEENGLFRVSLLWDQQNGTVDILYDFKAIRERIKNHSALDCLYILWVEKTNTSTCDLFTLRNIYFPMFPPENTIELKQLEIKKNFLLEKFENVKSLSFHIESGTPSIFQKFEPLPDSMNHQIIRKFWIKKFNFVDFVAIIFFTGLLLSFIFKHIS